MANPPTAQKKHAVPFKPKPDWTLLSQGAEARIYKIPNFLTPAQAAIAKERFSKTYRHPILDTRLTKARIKAEARALVRARRGGVAVPAVWGVLSPVIYIEFLDGPTVRQVLQQEQQQKATATGDDEDRDRLYKSIATKIGTMIATLHNTGTIHGDLTTSNMIYVDEAQLFLIDFGLARTTQSNPEEFAVDLYVLERALQSTHAECHEILMEELLAAYKANMRKSDAVLQRLAAVRMRGRKRDCFG